MDNLPLELKKKITEDLEASTFIKLSLINKDFNKIISQIQTNYVLVECINSKQYKYILYGDPENSTFDKIPLKMKTLTFKDKQRELCYVKGLKNDSKIKTIKNILYFEKHEFERHQRGRDIKNNIYWNLYNVFEHTDCVIKEYNFNLHKFIMDGRASSAWFANYITDFYSKSISGHFPSPNKIYDLYIKKYSYNFDSLNKYLLEKDENVRLLIFDKNSVIKNDSLVDFPYVEILFDHNKTIFESEHINHNLLGLDGSGSIYKVFKLMKKYDLIAIEILN